MSNSIKLSKKHGVNPTIPICFWCGKEKNEIALLGKIGDERKGEDIEAPMKMVLDYEPCEECKRKMGTGFTFMEATDHPNTTTNIEMQKNVYPTGRWMVVKTEAAIKIFPDLKERNVDKCFLEKELFTEIFKEALE